MIELCCEYLSVRCIFYGTLSITPENIQKPKAFSYFQGVQKDISDIALMFSGLPEIG